jgi:quinol monooxygenase YgiN
MFGLVVRFELRDAGAAEAFDALVRVLVEKIMATEPGTLVYATHTVEDAPLARIFYEVYRDRAAFEAHESQPHTAHFLSERERHVTSFRVEFLAPAAAKGLQEAA